MKKRLFYWQIAGFIAASLSGTLLQFLYDWLNESIFIAPFSAVNESTWEHMKILFFPLFIFAIIQYRFFKNYKNFWWVKLAGICTGLTMIPVLFYTYNGIFGSSPDWINIAIFFISAAAAYIFEAYLLKNDKLHLNSPWIAFAIICIIGVLFVLFTFATPKLPLFKDPQTSTYGIMN